MARRPSCAAAPAASISYETGVAVAYGLFNAQQRGTLIVDPGDKVYEGMVVGLQPCRRGYHRQCM